LRSLVVFRLDSSRHQTTFPCRLGGKRSISMSVTTESIPGKKTLVWRSPRPLKSQIPGFRSMTLCNAEPALPTTQMAEFTPSEAGSISSEAKVPKQCLANAPNIKLISANRFGHTSLEGNANLCAKFRTALCGFLYLEASRFQCGAAWRSSFFMSLDVRLASRSLSRPVAECC